MEEIEEEKMDLVNMKEGGAVELMNKSIQKALDSCMDINTSQKRREAILKIGFTPNRERTMVTIDLFSDATKTQGSDVHTFPALLKKEGGRAYAEEINKQQPLPGFDNVRPMTKEGTES